VPLSAHVALLLTQDNISTNYFSDHVQGGRSVNGDSPRSVLEANDRWQTT
jgi:hypothetical protein